MDDGRYVDVGSVAKAKELTDKILEMTKGLTLTGEAEKVEEEVAAYVALIEKREPLVQALLKLDFDDKTRNSKEFQGIKQTIADISKLDKSHMEFVHEIHETVKDTIKLTKQGQRINKGYQATSQDDVSSRFDIKQ